MTPSPRARELVDDYGQAMLTLGREEVTLARDIEKTQKTHGNLCRYIATLEASATAPKGEATVEAIAAWLHSEVEWPDPDFPQHSWPEHEDDTGQRGDGWLKIVPKDTREQFRDIARRLVTFFAAPKGEAVAWCQPTDCGKPTPRQFIVRYADQDVPDAVFDDEAEAYDHWERANTAWTCWLFGAMPLRTAPPSPKAEPKPSAVEAVEKLVHEVVESAYLDGRKRTGITSEKTRGLMRAVLAAALEAHRQDISPPAEAAELAKEDQLLVINRYLSSTADTTTLERLHDGGFEISRRSRAALSGATHDR